jgi:hypothetical protein
LGCVTIGLRRFVATGILNSGITNVTGRIIVASGSPRKRGVKNAKQSEGTNSVEKTGATSGIGTEKI